MVSSSELLFVASNYMSCNKQMVPLVLVSFLFHPFDFILEWFGKASRALKNQ